MLGGLAAGVLAVGVLPPQLIYLRVSQPRYDTAHWLLFP
jgi:hypothetical protein